MEETSTPQAQASDLEVKKYQLEERKDELEIKKLRQARSETWTKFFGTLIIAGAITGAIQWYGIREENMAKERALKAQQGQILVQLATAREAAIANLRAQMFNTLLQSYFKKDNEHQKIAILEMVGLNFRDAVQIKPMFKILDTELRGGKISQSAGALKEALHKSARAIIKDQLDQIRQARDGAVCRVSLTVGDLATPSCLPYLTIELLNVEEDGITVRTNTGDGTFLTNDSVQLKDVFKVTYYDMPMVDYTTARLERNESWKYSIVLYEATPEKGVEVFVAVLPVDSYNATDRYKFEDHFARFLDPSYTDKVTASEP